MESAAVEKVPVELSVQILRLLNSPKSLVSLIRASPYYYRIFRAGKESILSHLVKQMISPDAIHVAIAAAMSSQYNPRGPHLDKVKELMSQYLRSQAQSLNHTLPLSTSVLLCRLHPSVEYHIGRFTKQVLGALSKCPSPPGGNRRRKDAGIWKECAPVEKARLQRAFYRLELYAALFYSDHKPRDKQRKISPAKQEQIFFAEFEPWEIEELACIWEYLRSRVGQCFDELEDSCVDLLAPDLAEVMTRQTGLIFGAEKIRAGTGSHPTDIHCHTFFKEKYRFFTTIYKQQRHDDYIEYILSLGLPFLRRLFRAGRQKQMRLVLDNQDTSRQGFFTKAFTKWRKKGPIRHVRAYDDIPAEGKQSIRGPNAGYRWANEGLVQLGGTTYVCNLHGGLRYLGFAFWDRERLEKAGLLSQQ